MILCTYLKDQSLKKEKVFNKGTRQKKKNSLRNVSRSMKVFENKNKRNLIIKSDF